MPHLDPEELSLLALYGDWLDEEGRQHLSGCDACSAEYAALRRAVDAMKTTPDSSTLEVPGASVWSGIHRELGLSDAIREDPLGSAAGPATGTETSKPGLSGPTEPEPEQPAAPPADIRSVKKRPQGWQRRGTWLAVAAAGALVIAGATLWNINQAATPLARAELSPLAQHTATGSATVLESPDGTRTLEVKLSKEEAQGYQEVWLIGTDLTRLISLGIMKSDSGTFPLPADLNLADFPIVDVSDEPLDGNPGHSSVSIVRGSLTS
ncbi:anti-sigma factor domain-containing protein [Paenarthrobacter sp. TA1.8]|uniref:anti-sigma factor domain-containing protein n=1 Tax=Paenarthrobacter sp. TA1.8 TaxID=3400219 RepID=UPI003B4279AC